jgi:hypothetical protein
MPTVYLVRDSAPPRIPTTTCEESRGDVDLDAEEVYLADGRRPKGKVVEELAQRVLARHRGRPSVTGESARTPSLTVRVPPETRTALEELAKAQGKRLADVSRAAPDEYVSRHAS